MIRTVIVTALITGWLAAGHHPVMVRVDTAYVSEAMSEQLLSRGFHGRAGDGCECIYATLSAAYETCSSDQECTYVDDLAADAADR